MEENEITVGINMPKALEPLIRYKPIAYCILFYKIEEHTVAL
jgi:hypothetical protein